MWKIIQWSMAVVVAVVLIAVIVGQILAASTGRAKDASVAVLKEKLARLDTERPAVEPVALPEVVQVTPDAGIGPLHAATDVDSLRARWLALFEQMRELGNSESCSISRETWRTATTSVIDSDAPQLSDAERDELLQFQACLSPVMSALLKLRDQHEDLGALFDLEYLWAHEDAQEGLWYCEWLLRNQFWLGASLGDHAATIDTFTSLLYLMKTDLSARIDYWDASGTTNWLLLRPAVESGAVDDARWDRLLGLLAAHREQDFFFESIERRTSRLLHAFENWKTLDRDLKFSERPVTFLRTWAYPRITPALFNHDFDRFNRAMDELLDLTRIPYFKARPVLEEFCEDFGVEPKLTDLKLTRANPGWIFVLELSRHEILENARRQAAMDVIRMAILLERYKIDSGAYPKSLEALADELGGSVPINPMRGEPYLYEQTEEAFRLGYRYDQISDLVEHFGPVGTAYWHDPFGYGLEDLSE